MVDFTTNLHIVLRKIAKYFLEYIMLYTIIGIM
jgi:hypothetical protein